MLHYTHKHVLKRVQGQTLEGNDILAKGVDMDTLESPSIPTFALALLLLLAFAAVAAFEAIFDTGTQRQHRMKASPLE